LDNNFNSGITTTGTKMAINGGLQVYPWFLRKSQSMLISCVQVFNLASALLGTMLVDKLGRRKLFLISNIGMLIGQ
jgi:MFS family permease